MSAKREEMAEHGSLMWKQSRAFGRDAGEGACASSEPDPL